LAHPYSKNVQTICNLLAASFQCSGAEQPIGDI
jgi:hypothetical protein